MQLRHIVILFLLVISKLIQPQEISVKNNSFENFDGKDFQGWVVTFGDKENITKANNAYKTGNQSLKISHFSPSQSIVTSEPVKLKTGRLYKLTGFIKTNDVVTDGNKQYPTPLPACLRMESFPFTNASPSVGASRDWEKVSIIFFAVKEVDRIQLCLGHNGDAKGTAFFDNIKIEEVFDITEYIPKETIRKYGPAFRFEESGWIYLHIEGEPYKRGFQFGFLTSKEIVEFITKLSIQKNKDNPSAAWSNFRTNTDLIFLRKYDDEYLTEMKGICDGANKNNATVFNRPLDLLDIVTINSSIDLDYAGDAITKTPHALTGKSFPSSEDDQEINERLHKCSGFLANNSATKDNKIVFGQLFMWNGYMGPLFNIIVDVIPSNGNRLVYQTFPGGIHSGADFYINSSGILLGETTVGQTPFNIDGTPQSNRIRKAAQYANSIDDAVKILTENNNGLYTNDWLMADIKTNEIAILLLGTKKWKLWRSKNNEFYDDTKDWYWSNNNNKSLEVRKEYQYNDNNAPFDLNFRPWDRDIEFMKFYKKYYGKIDAISGINLASSSPTNRPHACDGKVTTSEMAEKLMFFANYGKTTMREMFVNENMRIPDLPGAIPKFSLGWTVFSPVYINEKIKELKFEKEKVTTEPNGNFSEVRNIYEFKKELLWFNTVYNKSIAEKWFISATASYWNALSTLPSQTHKAFKSLSNYLAEANHRYNYTVSREGELQAIKAEDNFHNPVYYYLPAIKGTFLLHQLRIKLGNEKFSEFMKTVHTEFKEREITTEQIINIAEKISNLKLKSFFEQWLKTDYSPKVEFNYNIESLDNSYKLTILSKQPANKVFNFFTTVSVKTEKEIIYKLIEIKSAEENIVLDIKEKPVSVAFNEGNDIPVERKNFYTFSNFYDDWAGTILLYGTKKNIEANHTLALKFSKTLADRFTETLLPVKKDCELTEEELRKDLIIIGGINENSILEKVNNNIDLKFGINNFEWNGKKYKDPDDGLFVSFSNPYNEKAAWYLFISNSPLQTYNMLKTMQRLPAYSVFKGDQIIERGYLPK